MKQIRMFTCLISSPGDCKDEREICSKVIETINISGLAKHLSIQFNVFMWENDVLPDMGKNGQEIIDEHINKSNYDIFIGIMKNRFGHPTNKAGSGTEHEFQNAIERKQIDSSLIPRVLFFFGKENVDPSTFDQEQYKLVKEFQSKVRPMGLYVDFEGLQNFEALLHQKLEIFIKENSKIDHPEKRIQEIDIVLNRLEIDLNDSLKTYNEKTPLWIDPIISSKREVPNTPNKNLDNNIKIESFIKQPDNIIIQAPSEFGLTSLAHYIKLEAWKAGKIFVYIDSKKTKKHKIVNQIKRDVEDLYFSNVDRIDCILLDSVSFEESGIMQMVKNVCDEFKNIPLIIFNTLDNNFFLKSQEDEKVEIKRNFLPYYLLPLQQNEVRKIVTTYSKHKLIAEDYNVMLNMVTKDMETLNMHRTVKNCISILRASHKIGSEYNPINRTKLLETILSTIFEEYEIPTYHDKKPDVKDCAFALGYLCELLILKKGFDFSEDFFKTNLREFCQANLIDLDINYLLSVLIDNSILGKTNLDLIYFKNSYWVFYFIAHRMNMNKEFLQKVYDDKSYIDFPEIIEFYTGIDRNKEDALIVLGKDLDATLVLVRNKVNIPDNINPYKNITWSPNVPELEKEEAKIKENVILSGLPDEVKDKYDDKHYNQLRPYNQVISSVFRDFSFLVLTRQISASSRALRNSDFVDPKIKRELLDKITQAWNELNKLLIILSPLLADKGNVAFDGIGFHLGEEAFNITDPVRKRLMVLLAVPTNVVKYFKDDLFSTKMGPLIIDKALHESNSLIKHELMLLIIAERPRSWIKIVDDYIISLNKNSFFLSDVLQTLKFNEDYKATEPDERRLIEMLALKCRAKHIYKKDNPDLGLVNKARKL